MNALHFHATWRQAAGLGHDVGMRWKDMERHGETWRDMERHGETLFADSFAAGVDLGFTDRNWT